MKKETAPTTQTPNDLDRQINLLLAMYNEQCTQARHYESQWATLSGYIVTVSGAITALMTYDQKITSTDIPAAAFVLLLGAFGIFLTYKYYERSQRHGKRAQKYREKLNRLMPAVEVNKLREQADDEEKQRFRRFQKLKLNNVWMYLHVMIAILGILLIAVAWFWPTG